MQHCTTAAGLAASSVYNGVSGCMCPSTPRRLPHPWLARCAGSFADKVSRQTAAASSLASSVADQIAIRQTETRTQSHTAGFEVSGRPQGPPPAKQVIPTELCSVLPGAEGRREGRDIGLSHQLWTPQATQLLHMHTECATGTRPTTRPCKHSTSSYDLPFQQHPHCTTALTSRHSTFVR